MSRTIRRTRDKRRNKSGRSNFDDWCTHDWVHMEGNSRCWVKVKLEGKAYWKGWWRFHSDRLTGWGNPKGCRVESNRIARAQNKEEIIRYFKDPDYEVLIRKPRCLSWDR